MVSRRKKGKRPAQLVRSEDAGLLPLPLEVVEAPPARAAAPFAAGLLQRSVNCRAICGFFLSGLLFSFLGSFLPAWGYHLKSDYLTVGMYFLFLGLGVFVSFHLTQLLIPRRGVRAALTLGSAIACGALLYLATVSGPVPPSLRMAGLFFIGFAAAMVNTAIFHAISPIYEHDAAATLNLGGVFFGLGCLATSVVLAVSIHTYSPPVLLVILACIPLFFFVGWVRAGNIPSARPELPSLRSALTDFRSPGAVMFTLLLFFQFGNEWAIAGWLPLFVIQRLGASPSAGLALLACYWAALLVGRLVAQTLLPRLRHSRILLFSVAAAFLGCLLLSATATLDGALVAVILLGSGFASIYPLTAEKIEHRFPYYHPGFYSGIFSLGLTGALLAPAILALVAHFWGVATVMWLPFLGSVAVFLLVPAIWLEARLTKA